MPAPLAISFRPSLLGNPAVGPAIPAPAEAQAPVALSSSAPAAAWPASVPQSPAMSAPLRQCMATYELERACAYAAVPDLERMRHRLAAACADLQCLEHASAKVELARHRVMEALNQRAEVAAKAGEVRQTEELLNEVQALGKSCRTAPDLAGAGVGLLANAAKHAFARAAQAAHYSAEYGDACQLRAKLADAAAYPGPWSFSLEERAFLFALCARRLTDSATSLLARVPTASFVQQQWAAMEALAAELGQPVPAELAALVELLRPMLADGASGDDASSDATSDSASEAEGLPALPDLVAQAEAHADLGG